jgi:hypothetical protein
MNYTPIFLDRQGCGNAPRAAICSSGVHLEIANISGCLSCWRAGHMEQPFAAAMEHIRLMESRIKEQERAIESLKLAGQGTTDSMQKLNLLHSALDGMRIELARLVPTEAQVGDPLWTRALLMAEPQRKRSV